MPIVVHGVLILIAKSEGFQIRRRTKGGEEREDVTGPI